MDELKLQMNMDEYLPLRDVVFNTLRQGILTGVLEPGERLMEIHLAERLGVSRTPIREAIRMLELEGGNTGSHSETDEPIIVGATRLILGATMERVVAPSMGQAQGDGRHEIVPIAAVEALRKEECLPLHKSIPTGSNTHRDMKTQHGLKIIVSTMLYSINLNLGPIK